MKATSIVRRVDDIGRICIPKEIRKLLKIEAGEPLEIWVDQKKNMICFQKYLTNEKVSDLVTQFHGLSDAEKEMFFLEIDS